MCGNERVNFGVDIINFIGVMRYTKQKPTAIHSFYVPSIDSYNNILIL